jgi:hypothetical protein
MRSFEQFEQKGIVPEKGKEAPLLDDIKERINEQIEKRTGIKAKIKSPTMHVVKEKAETKKRGMVEVILENPKAVRAGAAITLAALRTWVEFWGRFGDITPGFLKSESEKKRDKEIEERGWFGVFVDRTRDYYNFGGKLEDAVLEGKWDELMGAQTAEKSGETKKSSTA